MCFVETMTRVAEPGISIRSRSEQNDTIANGGMRIFHIFGPLVECERTRARGQQGWRAKKLDTERKFLMVQSRYRDVAFDCRHLSDPGHLARHALSHDYATSAAGHRFRVTQPLQLGAGERSVLPVSAIVVSPIGLPYI
jgi:hypothetical protein